MSQDDLRDPGILADEHQSSHSLEASPGGGPAHHATLPGTATCTPGVKLQAAELRHRTGVTPTVAKVRRGALPPQHRAGAHSPLQPHPGLCLLCCTLQRRPRHCAEGPQALGTDRLPVWSTAEEAGPAGASGLRLGVPGPGLLRSPGYLQPAPHTSARPPPGR